MSSEFDRDRTDILDGLVSVRAGLIDDLEALSDADLALQRRGGWSIAQVIHHIDESEWHYTGMIGKLRNSPSTTPPEVTVPSSTREAIASLERARAALFASVDGVSEDDFYRLGGGSQQYSILSALENVRQHDIEHGEQVRNIKALASRDGA
jgi:uncharacterized damage-inducible protein DinB